MLNFIINQASKVIVANDYEKKIFLSFCNESKISIVKNGIDLNEVNTSSVNFRQKYMIDDKFILFLGRFHKVKGIDTLLEAINLIRNNPLLNGLKIVIMGVDFGYESKMEEIITKLNLSKNISVIKKPLREYVISAYKECEFLVLPSRWELSPLTPLEGFAHKKAVISTTAHGIPFTVTHNENSLLVEPSNAEKLSEAILELLKDPFRCKKLGESGFNMVQTVGNSDRMVNDLFLIYEEVTR